MGASVFYSMPPESENRSVKTTFRSLFFFCEKSYILSFFRSEIPLEKSSSAAVPCSFPNPDPDPGGPK